MFTQDDHSAIVAKRRHAAGSGRYERLSIRLLKSLSTANNDAIKVAKFCLGNEHNYSRKMAPTIRASVCVAKLGNTKAFSSTEKHYHGGDGFRRLEVQLLA